MNSLPYFGSFIPDTSSYLATLSIQRPAFTPSVSIFSTVDSRPQPQYYWNGNAIEEPKELELVANILAGMKSKKVALGDEKVSSSRRIRSFGSDSDDDSNGIEETFSDSDDLCMKQSPEFSGEKKKSFSRSPKRSSSFNEKSSDGEEKLGSPISMFDADEISALDGDDQEQIQDSSDESIFRQSYSDFVKNFQETRSRMQDEHHQLHPCSPKQKRRFHGTPYPTIACEYHTQLHARCPPNCPERRPARPHPRSKKAKMVEEEFVVESKKQDTHRSSDSEMLPLDEDEDYEESDSKSTRLSSSKKSRTNKKNTSSRSVGRTGRKYLPQACDRHKMLHAKCPANCPDRIARDLKLQGMQDMVESDS